MTKQPKVAPYDGKVFSNLHPFEKKGFLKFLKWRFTGERSDWPDWVEVLNKTVLLERTAPRQIHYSVINHATTLIQVDGINILTDPIWSDRCSPVSFAGPKRVHRPGINFDDLPPIDLVLISHNHYDHLDLPTLKLLDQKFSPKFLVGLGQEIFLKSEGLKDVTEMDWYERFDFKGMPIDFVPAHHWSGRGLFDRFQMLWGGFVISSLSGPVYFAGDTGHSPLFKELREKYGPMKLSFLPIGAYEPRWFMKAAHVNGEEAFLVHRELESEVSVGMHFGTFQLTDESREGPMQKMQEIISKNPEAKPFIVPEFGKIYQL
ncbi:MAG: MBL fold metallo-hydrolase [Bacteriovoracaceae bacterium]